MGFAEEKEISISGLQVSQFKNKCEPIKVVHDITQIQALMQDIVEQLRKSTNVDSED
jgi:hypothetical protein